MCSENCRCHSCKNFEGCKEREAVIKAGARQSVVPKRRRVESGIKNPSNHPLVSRPQQLAPRPDPRSREPMRQQQALAAAKERARASELFGLIDAVSDAASGCCALCARYVVHR